VDETIELELAGGGSVLVQAMRVLPDDADEEDADQGPADVGLRDALSFAVVRNALKGIATEVHEAVKAAKPDVLEVEFGFELAIKGSQVVCLLVGAETKATLRVRLQWGGGERPTAAAGAT
jgi:Trypsin-co-occurring domain 1